GGITLAHIGAEFGIPVPVRSGVVVNTGAGIGPDHRIARAVCGGVGLRRILTLAKLGFFRGAWGRLPWTMITVGQAGPASPLFVTDRALGLRRFRGGGRSRTVISVRQARPASPFGSRGLRLWLGFLIAGTMPKV